MKKITRMTASSVLAGGLALGGMALTGGAATADTGRSPSVYTSSQDGRGHSDDWSHNEKNGHWDRYGRFHNKHDRNGWRDDHNRWRADDDYNGRWHDRDGCEHDSHGHWDRGGHYHHDR
ncbi:MAG: hypothetical protein ACLGH7_04735 [Actinomycetes bacterium]